MINETKTDSQIAELGRLGDRVVELYGMSLKMQKDGNGENLYAGINAILLDATTKFYDYWGKLKSVSMSEDDREKVRRITKKTEDKIQRMKQVG